MGEKEIRKLEDEGVKTALECNDVKALKAILTVAFLRRLPLPASEKGGSDGHKNA